MFVHIKISLEYWCRGGACREGGKSLKSQSSLLLVERRTCTALVPPYMPPSLYVHRYDLCTVWDMYTSPPLPLRPHQGNRIDRDKRFYDSGFCFYLEQCANNLKVFFSDVFSITQLTIEQPWLPEKKRNFSARLQALQDCRGTMNVSIPFVFGVHTMRNFPLILLLNSNGILWPCRDINFTLCFRDAWKKKYTLKQIHRKRNKHSLFGG